MLTLTILFISATVFGTLLNSVPTGTSWTYGAQVSLNNLRRIVGCSGLLVSVTLMMITICTV